MSFFNKKADEKRELPELPGMSRLPELPPLPSFPKNEFGNSGIGLQAIKATVNEGSEKGLEYMPKEPEEKRTIEAPDAESINSFKSAASRAVSKEPVFVKLDKFKEAVERFDEIKDKVSEIENALRKLREIKEKEDSELKAWGEEMQLIRQKVETIDNSLFNKI
jgi:hypothetical protein